LVDVNTLRPDEPMTDHSPSLTINDLPIGDAQRLVMLNDR
jgi:hypothetical protein